MNRENIKIIGWGFWAFGIVFSAGMILTNSTQHSAIIGMMAYFFTITSQQIDRVRKEVNK